jgi:hypothetical protein
MNSEIIESVNYDNYDDLQQVNFIFSQNFISLFWGLFNDKTDLRVRYIYIWFKLADNLHHPFKDLLAVPFRVEAMWCRDNVMMHPEMGPSLVSLPSKGTHVMWSPLQKHFIITQGSTWVSPCLSILASHHAMGIAMVKVGIAILASHHAMPTLAWL